MPLNFITALRISTELYRNCQHPTFIHCFQVSNVMALIYMQYYTQK